MSLCYTILLTGTQIRRFHDRSRKTLLFQNKKNPTNRIMICLAYNAYVGKHMYSFSIHYLVLDTTITSYSLNSIGVMYFVT